MKDAALKGPDALEELLDSLEEENEIRINSQKRAPLRQLLKDFLGDAETVVRLRDGDPQAIRQEMMQLSDQAFVDEVYAQIPPENMDKFFSHSNGKNRAAWLQGLQLYGRAAQPSLTIDQVKADLQTVGADATYGLNAQEQAALAETAKGATSTADLIRAAIEAGRNLGRRLPSGAVVNNERSTGIADYERFRSDPAFRNSLSEAERQRYHEEGLRRTQAVSV